MTRAGCAIALHSRRLAVLALLALFAAWAWAEDYSGTVTRVRDGDTVQVTTDRGRKLEVRLEGIDAPEKARDGRRAQRHANQSRAALTRIALNRRVTVQSSHTDRYGRRVGLLWVHTSQGVLDAGLLQVHLGMARIVPRYLQGLPADVRRTYRHAEATAKAQGRGIWAGSRPRNRLDTSASRPWTPATSAAASRLLGAARDPGERAAARRELKHSTGA